MVKNISWKSFYIFIFILVGATLILLSLGRTPFYKNGPIALWSGNVNSDQNSQQLADPYTFTHIIHGIGFYFLLWLIVRKLPVENRFLFSMAIEALWEIIENTDFIINRYRAATISLDYYGDSVLNSIGDILAAACGFWLAAKLPTWATIGIVLFVETVLLFWIRDNLLLNIIMLLYPVPAIKAWQGGL